MVGTFVMSGLVGSEMYVLYAVVWNYSNRNIDARLLTHVPFHQSVVSDIFVT
jgi:hypothetical protein